MIDRKESSQKYYLKNKEAINKKHKEYYESHKEEKARWSKEYHNRNRGYRLQRQRERRTVTIKWFREFKNKLECFYCDEGYFMCLDFHHIDMTREKESVGRMATQGKAKASILREISNCDVLCKNCHTKLHAGVLVNG